MTNQDLKKDEDELGGRNKPPWKVALVANLAKDYKISEGDPLDAYAEFDRIETIEAITQAIETDGHSVIYLPADSDFPAAIRELNPDICFNIAEGMSGDGREAQIPAVCEMMRIPYTGSKVVANSISLDKTSTKRIWRDIGLPTAPYREFSSLDGVANTALRFPLFVKPSREGTGMGIDKMAIVRNFAELEERVAWVLQTYRQPALVEEYLPGREFTVGFIGNPGDPNTRRNPQLYNPEGYHWFPVLEIDTQNSVTPGIYTHLAKEIDIGTSGAPDYLCPAEISDRLRQELLDLTIKAAQILNVCDLARVDFRLGASGQPYLLEINTLPGLNPALSDLCIMAEADGLSYTTLVTEILYLAAQRYGLPFKFGNY